MDFSITVPAFGDREDIRYCGVLRRGSQVNGAGQPFETVYDIDFASPINAEGSPNRVKIPNFDSSGKLINYTIVKREVVVNGITKVFKYGDRELRFIVRQQPYGTLMNLTQ